jgi:lipopolysaccharide/colanic/teichoic acid biosynthesis glycosyltransferase
MGKRIAKRAMDLFFGGIGFLISLPLWVVIALIIKLDSSGPILFKQKRSGKNGRVFTMLKFRSMVIDAEDRFQQLSHLNEETSGLIIKIPNDPRVTSIGKFLRKYSLDEIPQFVNVIMGDMSLIGPRPPSPDEYERYDAQQKRRLEAKPGLTGLWQVSGRKDTDFDFMVQKDLEYIEKQSLGYDLRILLKTIPVVLMGKGAR